MTANQEQKGKDVTLKSLETRLRCLPELQVPETLERRLLATIPDNQPKVHQEYQVKWHLSIWDFGATTVAAVLILALMLMVNHGLSTPSRMLPAELNDTSLCYTGWEQNNFLCDQNNTLIEDTNYTNYNGQW